MNFGIFPLLDHKNNNVFRTLLQPLYTPIHRLSLHFGDLLRMGTSSSSLRRTQVAPPAPMATDSISPRLALGAGCYWGTEKYVRKNFQEKFPGSVKSCTVGFMAPDSVPVGKSLVRPTYEQVCSGSTGHVEVLYVELNDPKKHFEELMRFFFQFHDPTTLNRQGNDQGTQYGSWIFVDDEQQQKIAKKVIGELQELVQNGAVSAYDNKTVSTGISKLTHFTPADAFHQRYLEKNPRGYCNHRIRFKQWPMSVM
jgi:peptide-methionine (S)-S-oxide reductase